MVARRSQRQCEQGLNFELSLICFLCWMPDSDDVIHDGDEKIVQFQHDKERKDLSAKVTTHFQRMLTVVNVYVLVCMF